LPKSTKHICHLLQQPHSVESSNRTTSVRLTQASNSVTSANIRMHWDSLGSHHLTRCNNMKTHIHRYHSHPPTIRGTHQPKAYRSAPRVRRLCRNLKDHVLPVLMRHIGDTQTDCGTLSSIYACPACGDRAGMVFDFVTGRPRTLWTGRNK